MPHSRSHLMPYGGLSDNESDLSFGADPGDYDSRQQSPYDNYRRGVRHEVDFVCEEIIRVCGTRYVRVE